jgi:hypothetical protein
MTYSRTNPSPRFLELLDQYAILHDAGDKLNGIDAEDTFDGRSLAPHAGAIQMVLGSTGSKTLLDYGCGKAEGYENFPIQLPDGSQVNGFGQMWGNPEITLYDPGYEKYSALPTGKFDCVICTDVLEHIPAEDLDWVIEEIFGFSQKVIFCTVALYPAKKVLPNGDNAHITLESPGWWLNKFEAISRARGGQKFYLIAMRTAQDMMFIES